MYLSLFLWLLHRWPWLLKLRGLGKVLQRYRAQGWTLRTINRVHLWPQPAPRQQRQPRQLRRSKAEWLPLREWLLLMALSRWRPHTSTAISTTVRAPPARSSLPLDRLRCYSRSLFMHTPTKKRLTSGSYGAWEGPLSETPTRVWVLGLRTLPQCRSNGSKRAPGTLQHK